MDWQQGVGLFLEGFSLLCELHGAQVSEGRVEPSVVVPPHVCFASMFVRQVRQCFSVVWADGFPRCRHRFPVM